MSALQGTRVGVRASFGTKKLVYCGLLMAIGVLLPQFFHWIGGTAAGTVFLPLHIAVLIGGLLLGPLCGCIVGLFTPILSFFISAMPPLPLLPFMVFELVAYGFFAGIFYKRGLHIYLSLLLAQVAGRLVRALCLWLAAALFQLSVPAVDTVLAATITGLPGILIQWLLVPALVLVLEKGGRWDG